MIVTSKQIKLFFQHLQALYIEGRVSPVNNFLQTYKLEDLWHHYLNETPWRPYQVFSVDKNLGEELDYTDLDDQDLFDLSAKMVFQMVCGSDLEPVYDLAIQGQSLEDEIERLGDLDMEIGHLTDQLEQTQADTIGEMAPAADISGIIAQKRPLIEKMMKLDLWRFPKIEAFIDEMDEKREAEDDMRKTIHELREKIDELEGELLDLSV